MQPWILKKPTTASRVVCSCPLGSSMAARCGSPEARINHSTLSDRVLRGDSTPIHPSFQQKPFPALERTSSSAILLSLSPRDIRIQPLVRTASSPLHPHAALEGSGLTRANLRREMEDRKRGFDDKSEVRGKIAEALNKGQGNAAFFDGVHRPWSFNPAVYGRRNSGSSRYSAGTMVPTLSQYSSTLVNHPVSGTLVDGK